MSPYMTGEVVLHDLKHLSLVNFTEAWKKNQAQRTSRGPSLHSNHRTHNTHNHQPVAHRHPHINHVPLSLYPWTHCSGQLSKGTHVYTWYDTGNTFFNKPMIFTRLNCLFKRCVCSSAPL